MPELKHRGICLLWSRTFQVSDLIVSLCFVFYCAPVLGFYHLQRCCHIHFNRSNYGLYFVSPVWLLLGFLNLVTDIHYICQSSLDSNEP